MCEYYLCASLQKSFGNGFSYPVSCSSNKGANSFQLHGCLNLRLMHFYITGEGQRQKEINPSKHINVTILPTIPSIRKGKKNRSPNLYKEQSKYHNFR